MINMIDITGSDLVKVAQAVYDLSKPQGMGFLHAKSGGLSDEQAKSLIQEGRIALRMDYVSGRACKMTVFRDQGKLLIRDNWYDHSENQLMELIDRIAV